MGTRVTAAGIALALAGGACTTAPDPEPSGVPTRPSPTPTPITPPPAARGEPVPPARLRVRLTELATTLAQPTAVRAFNDGSGRLAIVERKKGRVRIWTPEDGLRRTPPYLQIRAQIDTNSIEQGMFDIAFHPEFARNGHVFVTFSDLRGDWRLVRFTADPPRAPTVDPATQTDILTIEHRQHTNHYGAQMHFRDGLLYVSTGDGGGAGDPDDNAQDLGTLLGKVLRIDVDRTCGARAYCIPDDNPFADTSGARGEIYHYGLRNPWRWSFDRGTGAMWIADVGQFIWEEINRAPPGRGGLNFGWDCREGAHPFTGGSDCADEDLVEPRWEYSHDQGRCAIIGGFVYRGLDWPAMRGSYVYADWCSGQISALARVNGEWRRAEVATVDGQPTAFGESEAGELFLVTLAGSLYRVEGRARR